LIVNTPCSDFGKNIRLPRKRTFFNEFLTEKVAVHLRHGRLSLPMDALTRLVISMIVEREAELLELMGNGLAVEDELDVVRALLELIFSPPPSVPPTWPLQ
jgi:hypothetical protein